MWGILPAAGKGSRIQPLAFSKELLPIGEREGSLTRPRAVSDFLVERLIAGGADRLCFVIGPGKSDILEYHGAGDRPDVAVCYTVQPEPAGLCDAIFRALPFIEASENVIVGLPDTIWFPKTALRSLPNDKLSFLLFPVAHPENFDAVVCSEDATVLRIHVKQNHPGSHWIWGAFKMPCRILRELHSLWLERNRADEYIGTLVNTWIERGGRAVGVREGTSYLDVGTLDGYLNTLQLLAQPHPERVLLGELK